jgi:hypothetical protein
MSGIQLLVTDNDGIYVPQRFIEKFDMSLWNNIDKEDIDTIKAGPDQEEYWYAWENILDMASYTTQGNTWRLHQDGDLFAVCDKLMTDEEYEDFYGEPRSAE